MYLILQILSYQHRVQAGQEQEHEQKQEQEHEQERRRSSVVEVIADEVGPVTIIAGINKRRDLS